MVQSHKHCRRRRNFPFSTIFYDVICFRGISSHLSIPFPLVDTFRHLFSRRLFWKYCDKRRNCSKRAISPFATMFSIFSHRVSIQLWRFSIFWQNCRMRERAIHILGKDLISVQSDWKMKILCWLHGDSRS